MRYVIILFCAVLPLSAIIDLLGHILFIKIFRGNIKKVAIGTGRTILRMKKVEIR